MVMPGRPRRPFERRWAPSRLGLIPPDGGPPPHHHRRPISAWA